MVVVLIKHLETSVIIDILSCAYANVLITDTFAKIVFILVYLHINM